MTELLPYTCDLAKPMISIDGENLAIRYGSLLKSNKSEAGKEIAYDPGVLLWIPQLCQASPTGTPAVMRTFYYTSVKGDYPEVERVARRLKDLGIETPRVFKAELGAEGESLSSHRTITVGRILTSHRHHKIRRA